MDLEFQQHLVHGFWEEASLIGDLTGLRLEETLTSSVYACPAPGIHHAPWRSEEGVLMLEIRY